jgi:hypothetical protein
MDDFAKILTHALILYDAKLQDRCKTNSEVICDGEITSVKGGIVRWASYEAVTYINSLLRIGNCPGLYVRCSQ